MLTCRDEEFAGIDEAQDRVVAGRGLFAWGERVALAAPAIVRVGSTIRIRLALVRDGSCPEALGLEAEACALRQLVKNLAGGRNHFGCTDFTAAAAGAA